MNPLICSAFEKSMSSATDIPRFCIFVQANIYFWCGTILRTDFFFRMFSFKGLKMMKINPLFCLLFSRTNGFRPLLDNNAPRATPPIFLPSHLASLGTQFHPPLFPHLKGKEVRVDSHSRFWHEMILLKTCETQFYNINDSFGAAF